MMERTAATAATTRDFIVTKRTSEAARFPTVRLAASVMLMRPAPEGPQVLMLRRSAESPFMPGAFVFPGGAVDSADYKGDAAPGWDDNRVTGEFRARVPAELTTDQPSVSVRDAHALIRAAVREVAEEAGLTVDADGLTLFSHWITPPTERRRYDTHFFLSKAPSGQPAAADAIETHDERWLAPRVALELHGRGELYLVYPTIKHLEQLAAFDSIDALLAFARSKSILTIMPTSSPDEGFVLPRTLEGRW